MMQDVSDVHPDAASNSNMNAVEAIARGLAKRTGPKPGMRNSHLYGDVANGKEIIQDTGFKSLVRAFSQFQTSSMEAMERAPTMFMGTSTTLKKSAISSSRTRPSGS